jgi:hypothetical protein
MGENIEKHVRELEWSGMNWTDLAQDRYQWTDFVKMLISLRVT